MPRTVHKVDDLPQLVVLTRTESSILPMCPQCKKETSLMRYTGFARKQSPLEAEHKCVVCGHVAWFDRFFPAMIIGPVESKHFEQWTEEREAEKTRAEKLEAEAGIEKPKEEAPKEEVPKAEAEKPKEEAPKAETEKPKEAPKSETKEAEKEGKK